MKMREHQTEDKMSANEEKVFDSMDIQQCITYLEKEREEKSEEIQEGYTIDKKWLAESWAIYRNKKMDMNRRQDTNMKRGKKFREEQQSHVDPKALKIGQEEEPEEDKSEFANDKLPTSERDGSGGTWDNEFLCTIIANINLKIYDFGGL